MSEKYQPISCAQHERLELCVLRKSYLEVHYESEGGSVQERAFPMDVLTRNGEEWFKFKRENGELVEIRLDRIISFHEIKFF